MRSNLSFLYVVFLICLGALGIFIGHPNPVYHLPPVVFLYPFCLFILTKKYGSTGKKAFIQGLFLGLVGYSASLYWLTVPMHAVGQLPYFLAVPCVMLLGLYLGVFTGISAVFIRAVLIFFERRPQPCGIVCSLVCCALACAGCEYLCSFLFSGFPWVNTATALAYWPSWVQLASIIGSYGLTFLCLLIGIIFAHSFFADSYKKTISCIVASVVIIVAIVFYGKMRLADADTLDTDGQMLSFGLIQGNIDQNQKWNPEFQYATLKQYLDISKKFLAESAEEQKNVSMLIWPETCMPFYYLPNDMYAALIKNFAINNQVHIGFGILGFNRKNQTEYELFNRFQTINSKGNSSGFYDKQHLVPFGEFVPDFFNFQFIQNILQGVNFSSGTASRPITMPFVSKGMVGEASPRLFPLSQQEIDPQGTAKQTDRAKATDVALGVLICYEAIFPELAQKRVADGADVFINITNDGWFGETSAPFQHLGLAVMRSVEQKRAMVRSANTGFTSIIDPYGRVLEKGPLYKDFALYAEVPVVKEKTIYFHLFSYIDGLMVFGLLLPLLMMWHNRKSQSVQTTF